MIRALVIGVALVVAVVATSCEINHRSDQFACSKNTDCPSGRTCNDGFCILAGSIDAARPPDGPRGDAGSNTSCPEPCTSCNTAQKTCTVNCMQAGGCNAALVCPAGYKCDFLCNTDNACRDGINCQQAASCSIECAGKSSCETLRCGAGPCEVSCSGPETCRDVRCGSSCACDVVCTGNQSCQDGIVCSSFGCRSGSGCTSVPLVCHSCN